MDTSYDHELRDRLAANLAAHPPYDHPVGDLRQAAVAVVVVDSDAELHGTDEGTVDQVRLADIPGVDLSTLSGRLDGVAGGPAVLLTRRAAKLRNHGGQWALPGGRVDPGESPFATAVRELHEELGLPLGAGSLLGRLDDYPTRSGYVIRPFVFWGGADPELHPDPREVATVHRVSVRELCRHDSPRFVTIPESPRPVIQLPIGGDLIHAPTAAVLYQFRLVAIEGRSERVDHLEQPVFAWR
jgi:8-oxo-dGTP pyrophosphatase MutT (NUDIX family)